MSSHVVVGVCAVELIGRGHRQFDRLDGLEVGQPLAELRSDGVVAQTVDDDVHDGRVGEFTCGSSHARMLVVELSPSHRLGLPTTAPTASRLDGRSLVHACSEVFGGGLSTDRRLRARFSDDTVSRPLGRAQVEPRGESGAADSVERRSNLGESGTDSDRRSDLAPELGFRQCAPWDSNPEPAD